MSIQIKKMRSENFFDYNGEFLKIQIVFFFIITFSEVNVVEKTKIQGSHDCSCQHRLE